MILNHFLKYHSQKKTKKQKLFCQSGKLHFRKSFSTSKPARWSQKSPELAAKSSLKKLAMPLTSSVIDGQLLDFPEPLCAYLLKKDCSEK